MPTAVVHPEIFPIGTAVEAWPEVSYGVQRREHLPIPGVATASGVIGTDCEVSITAASGTYILVGVVDEVQRITVNATAGQFKLTYSGQTTADIAFNASAAAVTTAFTALSTVGAGNAVVTGGPGNSGGTTPYFVTFTGALAGLDASTITAANGTTPLSGGAATVTVQTDVVGSAGTAGTQRALGFAIP
jgi:hypothetical protein